jgi:hypothetical protein
MPIAVWPRMPLDAFPTVSVDTQVTSVIPAGTVVAVASVAGVRTLVICGALPANSPQQFLGILAMDSVVGQSPQVFSNRGTRATPLVEGGGPLPLNVPIFLSLVPGRVTSIPPGTLGSTILRIGESVSTTEIILLTDSIAQLGS